MKITRNERTIIEKIREIKQNAGNRRENVVILVFSADSLLIFEGTPRGLVQNGIDPSPAGKVN